MPVNSGKQTRTTHLKAGKIQAGQLKQAGILLQNLPQKPQSIFSLLEAIDQLRDPLQAALMKGYSYEELATILQTQGIPIQESTLKSYLASASKVTDRPQEPVKLDFWHAYQASLQEREEVYRHLAIS